MNKNNLVKFSNNKRSRISKKSYIGKPLISIITVTYNCKKILEQSIRSVLNLSYDNIEFIIVDGGSTDGTLKVIHKYMYVYSVHTYTLHLHTYHSLRV